MRVRYARKLSIFIMYRSPANFYFSFSMLRHYQRPECFYVNNCCIWARAIVLPRYRNWQRSQCGQRLRWSALADKIKTIVSKRELSRNTTLNMRSGWKVCKKWWDGFWTQTIIQNPTKIYLLLFGPFKMFLEICMQIYSVLFALSRQIN